jgi:hypothetical protein
MSDERWNPHNVLTVPPKRPSEALWSVRFNRAIWSCELRFHSESYGWAAQILRDGELFAAHAITRPPSR